MKAHVIIGIVFLMTFSGCVSYESLVNFSETNKSNLQPKEITNYEPLKIQPDDVIQINLSSTEASALNPFIVAGSNQVGTGGASDNFLVSADGYIEFPTIGKVKVDGLRIEEVQEIVLEALSPYFTEDPIIQVRLMNFKINVNGEVGGPGSFIVNSNRISVFEAITLAGDFTDYSRRDSIMIIREIDGVRNFGYVDFNTLDVFDSPYFYLKQNDIVYVQPSKAKVNIIRDTASRALPYITGVVSIVALILSVVRTIN
jgi:polysaccharide export outer membrane protein